jgi:fibrillarin-like rRNA methylase
MAIIIKRQSVEDFGEDRRQVLNEVQQLITGGNMQMVSIIKSFFFDRDHAFVLPQPK